MDPVSASMIASGASAGGGLVGGHLNRKFQERTNDRMIGWDAEKMSMSRQWALDDRNYENEWNSPKQQMQRLKEAGLSANLIYGNGNAVQSSSSTRQAQDGSPHIETPKFNENLLSEVFGQFFNLQRLQAETDNLKAQADVHNTEALLKETQIGKTQADTELSKWDLTFKRATAGANIDKLNLENDKTRADIAYTLDQNQRAEIASINTANKTNAEIAQIYKDIAMSKIQKLSMLENIAKSQAERQKISAEIKHLESMVRLTNNESAIKKIHQDMLAAGISPSDPLYARVAVEAANSVNKTVSQIYNALKQLTTPITPSKTK